MEESVETDSRSCDEAVSFDDEEESFIDDEDELAHEESRAVVLLRATVIAVLVASAIYVSALFYAATSRLEQSNFEKAFDDASNKILENFPVSIGRILDSLDGLAVDLSSFSAYTVNSTGWPMVTLPDFQVRAKSTLNLAGITTVMLLPIVTGEKKHVWESYSVDHRGWLNDLNDDLLLEKPVSLSTRIMLYSQHDSISDFIFNASGPVQGKGPFAPLWQSSPLFSGINEWVNFDLLSSATFKDGLQALLSFQRAILGPVIITNDTLVDRFLENVNGIGADKLHEPVSPLFYPIKTQQSGIESSISPVAILLSLVPWTSFFVDALPLSDTGVVIVMDSPCGQDFSFELYGDNQIHFYPGDIHDSSFDRMGKSMDVTNKTDVINLEHCDCTLRIYPTQTMRNTFITHKPTTYTAAIALSFVFVCLVFLFYDYLVERRQKVVMDHALHTSAIVTSLFPEQVRERLFRRSSMSERDDGSVTVDEIPSTDLCMVMQPAKMRLKSFLREDEHGTDGQASTITRPIADLFPNCTVLFADISGFTAWSSLRDPTQVFTLLESVYSSFDKAARKHGVFKVETIGDSYVAVTGLPEPQENHAVIMARFARTCRARFGDVTRKLERSLGPDTGDLRMRFGLHSGPVTAGVLRGEKSRFQLFGDTVNTAARMESTGERDLIQVSQATADLLLQAGKTHWLRKRDKPVHAKGKGNLQTYFLDFTTRRGSTGENSRCSLSSVDTFNCDSSLSGGGETRSAIWGSDEEIPEMHMQRTKHQRLIDYNVDLLSQLLRHVVARRKVLAMAGRRCSQGGRPPDFEAESIANGMVLDEVTEVIKLPNFNPKAFKGHVDPDSIELGDTVIGQLKRFVTIIAAMYRNNPFHNFEHASHVTMSVNKLLQRVVAPEVTFRRTSLQMNGGSLNKQIASDLHNYTYGITSDPLTQFAIVFGALIHDVDHWGVSNGQLIKEGVPIAEKYSNKSIAEQNSVDISWNLLMDKEEFGDLQKAIFPTDAEYKRFRQVVVNVVMATDIFDKELGDLRKKRWERAFSREENCIDLDSENRKATIVIEHIMQASDVAHTMQHWHVYQKWNRRLFDELYTAYKAGRMESDPSSFWYEGELKFFDGYVIPLARKLKECGVFGVASDECLSYAIENRKEWESKGEDITRELVSNYKQREQEEVEASGAAQSKKKKRFARRRSLFTSGG